MSADDASEERTATGVEPIGADGDIFSLPSAVTALQNCGTSINSMWMAFIVANFAFAGFGLAGPRLPPVLAVLLTMGYLSFASGHFVLVKRTIEAANAVAEDIARFLERRPESAFHRGLSAIRRTAYRPRYSLIAHVVSGACIIAIIWYRTLSAPDSPDGLQSAAGSAGLMLLGSA